MAETWGFSLPAAASVNSASTAALRSAGFRRPASPARTPTTEQPLMRTRFAFTMGRVPLAKPTVSKRPPKAMQRSDCSKTAPPTGS